MKKKKKKKKKIKEVKLELEEAKKKQKIELEQIKTFKAKIENESFISSVTKAVITVYTPPIITLAVNKEIRDFIAVKIANKYDATIYGKIHSFVAKMPESYRLFRIGIEQDKDQLNREYIENNGVLLDSIHELNSPENEELIIKRIKSENPNKRDSKVLILDTHSSISKAIVKSEAFKEFIKFSLEDIADNEGLLYKKIEFSNEDKDLYSTFHGAEIYDAHFDSEGNLILRLEDYYNFNPSRTSVKGQVGYKLQEQGDLEVVILTWLLFYNILTYYEY